jgi:hypothetical protein
VTSRDLLRVEGADQMRRLSRDLRRVAADDRKVYRRETVRRLKSVADVIVRAQKSAVLALPSKGENARRGRRSLRRRVATATVSRVRTAATDPEVSVLINPKRMGPGEAALPAYMNAEPGSGPWRHPVPNTDTWVTQRPTPWWDATARPFEAEVQRQLLGVLDAMADEIERG